MLYAVLQGSEIKIYPITALKVSWLGKQEIGEVFAPKQTRNIPHICQFLYTTAFLGLKILRQILVRKFAVPFLERKCASLKKVVTNMSFDKESSCRQTCCNVIEDFRFKRDFKIYLSHNFLFRPIWSDRATTMKIKQVENLITFCFSNYHYHRI